MKLTSQETKMLLGMVSTAKPDAIDCDGCLESMAEFVELELTGQAIPDAMQKVQRHLDQCMCCNDEHAALLKALRSLEA